VKAHPLVLIWLVWLTFGQATHCVSNFMVYDIIEKLDVTQQPQLEQPTEHPAIIPPMHP